MIFLFYYTDIEIHFHPADIRKEKMEKKLCDYVIL